MEPLISITAASQNTPEWAELLIKSVRKYTTVPHEIIIIDNESTPVNKAWLKREAEAGRVGLHENAVNIGHGPALDQGSQLARGHYVCAMDIDSFFLRPGWDTDLIALYESDPAIRMIARRGRGEISVTGKPISPPIYFYERVYALQSGLTFRYAPGVLKGSTDATMAAYWQVVDAGYRVHLLGGIGSMATNPGHGDIVAIAGKSTIYHHYYGARFSENYPPQRYEQLDGRTLAEYLARKADLFSLPHVKEILSWNR